MLWQAVLWHTLVCLCVHAACAHLSLCLDVHMYFWTVWTNHPFNTGVEGWFFYFFFTLAPRCTAKIHLEHRKLHTTYCLFCESSKDMRKLRGFIIFTALFAFVCQANTAAAHMLHSQSQLTEVQQLDKRLRWPEYMSPEGDRTQLRQKEWEWHVSFSLKKRSSLPWAT